MLPLPQMHGFIGICCHCVCTLRRRQFATDLAELGMRREGLFQSRRSLVPLIQAIQEIIREGARGAGIRRVQYELARDYGYQASRNLVADIMRAIDGSGPIHRVARNFRQPRSWDSPGMVMY